MHKGGLQPNSSIHFPFLWRQLAQWLFLYDSAAQVPCLLDKYPCEWRLHCVEIKSHENSYYNYIKTLVSTWLKGVSFRFHLNQPCGTLFGQSYLRLGLNLSGGQ